MDGLQLYFFKNILLQHYKCTQKNSFTKNHSVLKPIVFPQRIDHTKCPVQSCFWLQMVRNFSKSGHPELFRPKLLNHWSFFFLQLVYPESGLKSEYGYKQWKLQLCLLLLNSCRCFFEFFRKCKILHNHNAPYFWEVTSFTLRWLNGWAEWAKIHRTGTLLSGDTRVQ